MKTVQKLALIVQNLQETVLRAEHILEFAIAIQINNRPRRQAPALHVNFPDCPPVFVKAMDHTRLGNQADVRPAIQIEVAD